LTTLRSDHDARYFEIFKEYFGSFHEVGQTLLHCQYGLPLPETTAASSIAFADTRMLYGNLFEVLSSTSVILACLNNIKHLRPFDMFEAMDLRKYLTTNKARRGEPFRDNETYSTIMQFLDSTLRNASHHNAISIDHQSARITFRSGGSGAAQHITYADYLFRCNQVFLRLCVLLMLELSMAAS
jgi:hypothetical protein